jgi:hypothetical protein
MLLKLGSPHRDQVRESFFVLDIDSLIGEDENPVEDKEHRDEERDVSEKESWFSHLE